VTAYEPDDGFRAAITQIDLGEVDLIVTPSAEVARWAERHGYRIERGSQGGTSIYEIWGGTRPR
jgi:hypothetical protein